MREFTFATTYQQGVDPLMDESVECPEPAADSIGVPLAPDAFRRVERFTGPPRCSTPSNGSAPTRGTSANPSASRSAARRGTTTSSTRVRAAGRPLLRRRHDRLYLGLQARRSASRPRRAVRDPARGRPARVAAVPPLGPQRRAVLRRAHRRALVPDRHLRDAETWRHGPLAGTELPGEQRVALREAFRRG